MNDNQVLNVFEKCVGGHTDREVVEELLRSDFGFERLGRGATATAFLHPTDSKKVVRIGSKADTDSWLSFALFAMETEADCFPRIHKMRVFNNLSIVVMESLKPNDFMHQDYNKVDCVRCSVQTGVERFGDPYNFAGYFDQYSVECIREMYRLFGRPDDLHGNNVMLRNGRMVITDPYYNTRSKDHDLQYCRRDHHGNVEVITRGDRAIMAEIRSDATTAWEAQDRLLRLQPFPAREPRLERVQGALLPGQYRMRGISAARHAEAIRPRGKARWEFDHANKRWKHEVEPAGLAAADFAELERKVIADHFASIMQFADKINGPNKFVIDQLRACGIPNRFLATEVRALVGKSVRFVIKDDFAVQPAARLERRPAGLADRRSKKWEAAVPCQKAAAERARERAEVYRQLHRRAA